MVGTKGTNVSSDGSVGLLGKRDNSNSFDSGERWCEYEKLLYVVKGWRRAVNKTSAKDAASKFCGVDLVSPFGLASFKL